LEAGRSGIVTVYRLFGWDVSSEFPLYLPESSTAPSLTFRLARLPSQPDELPDGEVLLDYQDRGKRWYSVSRGDDGGLVFRFFGLADLRISPERDTVDFALLDSTDPGMAAVLATGAVPSLLLDLQGMPVLHASAVVARDGTTVAFLGRSGQGKSTLATLLCLDGGELLTDDVLPVAERDPVTVSLGSAEVRLREQARELVTGDLPGARTSADGRSVVNFRSAEVGRSSHPLDAVFIPLPNREGLLDILRIPKIQAHLTVLRYPRLLGWKVPDVLRAQFELASAVAAQVPVFLARVPWGPPFRDDIATTIWGAARHPETVAMFSADQASSSLK
jgi:hypothetical protein